MIKDFTVNNGLAVFGKGEFTYQKVLDDFSSASFIGVMTFNISPRTDSSLLNALKRACLNGADATIITNIPKRFPSYYGVKYAAAAKDMIDLYKHQLDPAHYGMRLNPYFTFKNHAKIIMTENIAYWGSSNFSDESKENFECGTISTDKELISFLRETLFPEVTGKSVPYYKHNFAVAIANLNNLILECQKAHAALFEAAFEPWADYDTNFEEKWIYRTTDSGVTVSFLRGFIDFFSQFDEALDVIDSIIEEYWDEDELPEEVSALQTLFEEYKHTYESFFDGISGLFDELEQMASYDTSEEACRKIVNDYGMEAIDEALDYYAEKAMNEAAAEYEELIVDAEESVKDALAHLMGMIAYFEKLRDKLYLLLEINSKIDNTHVR